jgi:hypothetical protein
MKALEHLRALVEFAYANGYHELGYDPIKEIEAKVSEYELAYSEMFVAVEELQARIEWQTHIIESCCSAPLIDGECAAVKAAKSC